MPVDASREGGITGPLSPVLGMPDGREIAAAESSPAAAARTTEKFRETVVVPDARDTILKFVPPQRVSDLKATPKQVWGNAKACNAALCYHRGAAHTRQTKN